MVFELQSQGFSEGLIYCIVCARHTYHTSFKNEFHFIYCSGEIQINIARSKQVHTHLILFKTKIKTTIEIILLLPAFTSCRTHSIEE